MIRRSLLSISLPPLLISVAGLVLASPATIDDLSSNDAAIEDHTAISVSVAEQAIADLGGESEVVALGRVSAVTVSSVGPQGQPGIHTAITLSDADVLKGDAASSVELWVQGGTLEGKARRLIGQATFVEGQNVLVFLKRSRGGSLWPTRMALGKWRLETREGSRYVAAPAKALGELPLESARSVLDHGVQR